MECQAIRKSKATKRKWALKLDFPRETDLLLQLVETEVMAHPDKNDVFEARLNPDWKPFKSNLTSESAKAHALKSFSNNTNILRSMEFLPLLWHRPENWTRKSGFVVSITVIIIFDIKVGLTKWRSSPEGGVAFWPKFSHSALLCLSN